MDSLHQEESSYMLSRGFLLANSTMLLAVASFKLERKTLRVLAKGALALVLSKLANFEISIWRNIIYLALAVVCFGLWRALPILKGLFESTDEVEKKLGRFRPLFFLSCTTHCRFTPAMHKFKYPLLYIGIPLDFTGSIGNLLSVQGVEEESPASKAFHFFTLDPKSYLEPELPFATKLQPVLAYHGFDLKDFPYGYLITTPKFFGYSFNPVSYFYLYDKDMNLRLIVLEVNNTFGERHVYLLDAEGSDIVIPRSGYDYAGVMRKSFHISPFNHRSGDYLIQCRDPIRPKTDEEPKMDIHVTVRSREGAKTMVARAFSTGQTFDPVRGSIFGGLWLVIAWGWAVFLAVPQTMLEAWKIYRKATKVYERPEPLPGSGQRSATKTELEMQEMWLDNLQHKVASFPRPVLVTGLLPQTSALKEPERCCYYSPSYNKADSSSAEITIRVKTPRFFSRFFSHQNVAQTLYLDTTTKSEEHRAADINDSKLLVEILTGSAKAPNPTPLKQSMRWKVWTWLRKRKTDSELGKCSSDGESQIGELPAPSSIKKETLSAMDIYFLSNPSTARRYQRVVAQAVLIDTVAFQDPESFELYQSMLRFVLLGASALVIGLAMINYHADSFLDLMASGDISSVLSSSPRFLFELGAINAPILFGVL